MKKMLSWLGAMLIVGTVATNVVACMPPKNDGNNNIIGDKLDLNLFSYDKIEKLFSLKKVNAIVNDEVNLTSAITKGIQNLSSVYLPWDEVNITVKCLNDTLTFNQVYMKMEAKPNAKSVKGSVMWGNLETKSYVDLRPTLKNWLSSTSPKLTVKDQNELDAAATNVLGGPAFKQTNLNGLGLEGTYDAQQKRYTVSVISGKSNFFQASEIIFNVDMNN
ncbi:lipoprotein [Spiroplasma melliferum]|uniref:lipoprotein n=1 Tax=Spiroplasma melliferum TaxID=2134 RepID=UPI000C77283B|nr:lipoprotein [Spiroplasma melliferum]